MATIKQEEQPKPPAVVGSQDLDTLQSMLNMVLITSGRFIKEHQSGGGTGRMKVAMQHTVPVATERFHDALDELENEVRLAQIVLRRDLALLKQDRKKREMAAKEKEAEKARLAAESRNAGSAAKKEAAKLDMTAVPTQPDAATAKEPEKPAELPKALEREAEKIIPPPIATSTVQVPERDPLFDGTPTTANPPESDFDFDAMFGDAMDTTGDGNNMQDDMMDTSGDMGFDFNEEPSLLRGLEDFAKSGDNDNTTDNAPLDLDITMSDLTDLHNNSNSTTTAVNDAPAPPAPAKEPTPPPAPAPAETTNEDGKVDTTSDTNNDDVLGGMMTENLDDLFNMDEYENPETQAFDDAFFDFTQ